LFSYSKGNKVGIFSLKHCVYVTLPCDESERQYSYIAWKHKYH